MYRAIGDALAFAAMLIVAVGLGAGLLVGWLIWG
jgi:hypothetical protein